MHGKTSARFARTMLLATVALLVAGAALAQDDSKTDPWEPGTQWLTLRAGYAKMDVDGSGNGGPGYGFAYSHMLKGFRFLGLPLFEHYSIGASVQHDLVGHFGPASEISVPVTAELTRHYAWPTVIHPYVGLGTGYYYRKTYRTGDDLREVVTGYFVSTGVNTEITEHNLVGFDLRMSRYRSRNDPPNPVFGPGSVKEANGVLTTKIGTQWSAKLTWSFAY